MSRVVFGITVAIALSTGGLADVTLHQGASEIGALLGDATFDGFATGDPLQNYQEGGLTIDVNDTHFGGFRPVGFPAEWDGFYYPNGGVNEQVNITRTDGQDFNVLEMNVSHGFAGSTIFVWIQAYLDNGLEDQFNVDVQGGTLIGLTGEFDEVRIASYGSGAIRDARNPANLNAIAQDNVAFGLVPEPTSLALLSVGALALLRRRR